MALRYYSYNMNDYSYPNELIKKVQSRILKQLDGNHVHKQDVSFTIKRQGVGEITAKTSYTVDCTVNTRTSKGKKNEGSIVKQGTLQAEIQNFTSSLADKESVQTAIKEHIKSLPMHGFGAEKIQFPLKTDKAIFTEHVTCGTCNGQGKRQCPTCHGSGQMQCPVCLGSGVMRCMTCMGSGYITVNGQQQPCPTCQSRGEVYCTRCNGQRVCPCTSCQARGFIMCGDCNAEGVNSIHAVIEPHAITHCDIFITDLDADPKNMVAKIGAAILAKGGHLIPKVTKAPKEEEEDLAYYEIPAVKKPDNAVHYIADVPWAVIDVIIQGQSTPISLVGSKGAVADSGKFMEPVVQKPFELIARAARSDGFISGLLKDACDYTVTRETLSAVARMKPKQAHAHLQKLYGLGFDKQTWPTVIKNTYQAIKNITKRPRYIGLAVGLLAAAAVYYQWFMGDTRAMTEGLKNDYYRYGLDVLSLITMIAINFAMIKGIAFFTFQSVMRDIGITTKKMPPMGKAGIYALLGNISLWGAFFVMVFN